MLKKPDTCQQCPFYGNGWGYVPDEVNPTASVVLLVGAPGSEEVRGQLVTGYMSGQALYQQGGPRPLSNKAGFFLTSTLLPLAGLTREQVSIHSIIKCQPPITKGPTYEQALQYCQDAHLTLPTGITTCVASGEEAWHATQGQGYPLHDWRGYLGRAWRGRRVYATVSPADLLRDPHGRFVARLDWKRLRRHLAGGWPRPVPPACVASPSSRPLFVRLLTQALEQPEIMVDTEYIPDKKLMTHFGAAWLHEGEVKGFQIEWVTGQATSVERALFAKWYQQACLKVKMGFWNAKADLPILEHNLGHIPLLVEDPMQAHAVLWPDMDHDLGFVASIYGQYDKLKHLSKDDILAYHWGDCIELVHIWEALKQELAQDMGCERKYREQNLPLLPILLETEAHGIKVNQARIQRALPEYEQVCQHAMMMAQAYCGYPLNVGSVQQIIQYLNKTEGFKLKNLDANVVAVQRAKFLDFVADDEEKAGFSIDYVMQRVHQGAHPLLECRVMYAQAKQVLSHYLIPLVGVERVYPQINIHTQAGGRHSTTNPPLATLPDNLRDVVMPDPGTVWVGWDWDQQEPRIQRAESGSRVLGAAFDEGVDIHTQLVCLLYGWPFPQDMRNPHTSDIDKAWRAERGWQGKEDPRRVFAKTTRYEINYGGTGEQAVKKAIRMGVEPKVAKQAAQTLLASDPDLAAWFTKVEKEVVSTRITRSWGGGRRIFYWMDSLMKVEEMKRQARNFPPQGGGADLYNLTIVEIAREVPQAKFVYGMHDSQWWRCSVGMWPRVYARIKDIVSQPRTINGVVVHFPGSWKVMFEDGRVEKLK